MGVDFDKIYYESQTYLEGKGKVMEGLEKGFSIAVKTAPYGLRLTKDGLDEKLLLRADGTSVYMTVISVPPSCASMITRSIR